ncbi:MAG TPA: protein kinase [Kofleriaceae bacterium]|nr:protein kinase [Kofleriaceae bacterium]
MQTVGGRYVLDGRLGEGGMGQVYRAKHVQLGKAFALKIIAPAFADDTVARARFIQEAKLASEISHPNIVSVVDYGEDAQFGAYMVMELVDGEPLLADSSAKPSMRRALDVLAQVADALEFIHKRGIVHGDVKADNILLAAEPTADSATRRRRVVRLLDFGLAHRHDAHQDQVSGSPHYLAPERCAGAPATVATDIYALGVLGYLLFTSTLPFDGSVMDILMAHIQLEPEPLAKRRGEAVDEAIEGLIARAMAKEPGERHATAAAFRYELNTVMDMLDMGRRRTKASGTVRAENTHAAALAQAFERSRVPQALLSVEGRLAATNRAFAKLVGKDDTKELEGLAVADTALATYVPGLQRALRAVHADGKPAERRAKVYRGADKSPLELVLWILPLPVPGQEIHVLVRVDEVDSRPRE